MTSQTNLPLIPAGIIWDGVTQYQCYTTPPDLAAVHGTVSLLRMVGDGTRRFTDWRGSGIPATHLVFYTNDGWETIGVTYENAFFFLRDNPVAYLDYDGSSIRRTRQPNPLPPDLPAQRRRIRP